RLLVGLHRVAWVGEAVGFDHATSHDATRADVKAVAGTLHGPAAGDIGEQGQSAVDRAGVGVALKTRLRRVVRPALGPAYRNAGSDSVPVSGLPGGAGTTGFAVMARSSIRTFAVFAVA